MLVKSKMAFGWCINPYNGCYHGCRYCFGMCTTGKNYKQWRRVEVRKNLIERLREDICKLKKSEEFWLIRDIFLGAITDSYQPIEKRDNQTRQVIEVLIENELPFTVITKSDLVLRDIDLFKGYKMVQGWCYNNISR